MSKESDQGDRSIKERHHSDAGDSRETYSIPEGNIDSIASGGPTNNQVQFFLYRGSCSLNLVGRQEMMIII